MAPTVVLGLSDLRMQARDCTPAHLRRPAAVVPAEHPRPLVRLVVLSTAAILAVSAALPGSGLWPGAGPAEAAPAVTPVVDAPAAPVLPQTGGAPGTTSTPSVTPVRVARASASCTAPCSTSQVISVTIKPGPFEVSAAPASVAVSTDGTGTGRGRIAGIRVTDLRGADEGWTLATRIVSVVDARTGAAVAGATVELVPVCRRTAGPLTLESADPSVVGVGGTASLCIVPIASSGSLAGGLVSAYADVVVRGAPADARVTVRLATSLS